MPTRVIDVEFDANTFFARWGKLDVPLAGCAYADSLDKGDVNELGQQATTAVTMGVYKPETAKLKMRRSVWTSIVLPKLPKSGFGNVRFPVTVIGNHPEIGNFEDKLSPAFITKVSEPGFEAGNNKADIIELELKVVQYYWDGHTLNRVPGVPQLGALSFSITF